MTSDARKTGQAVNPAARSPTLAKVQVLPNQSSDAELLDLVLSGHASAAARLHERFSPDINRVVWKLLGADSDHNDVVHDIFIKIWTLMAEGRVKRPDRLSSWVVAVAVHTVRKELRRRHVRRRLLGIHAEPTPLVAPDNLEARDLLRNVYDILGRLPPDERVAFSLRYLDQRRLAEVAELCGCSLATVKRRINRAERRFAQLARPYPAITALLSGRNGESRHE
jgi:RNA polymerase sigma-70 factor (ECF subfamily)